MFKKFFSSNWYYLALIVLLTLPLCCPLLGGQLISGHDSGAAYIRALSMSKYMGHGQFLVRWSPEINWGYGYPMFNFYPPFFSIISVVFYQLVPHMVLAINGACIFFWVLSGFGMFLLARECWGDEGGLLSALLYLYAPYHLIDIYVRGAFAEFSAFAFFPLLILSILKLSRGPSLGFFTLGLVSVFGLSLAHNIMSMLFFPVALAFMFFLYFFERKPSWVIRVLAVFVLGLMMSSFFWLPAIIEKKFLNLDFLLSMRYDFHKSFITLKDLFWPLDVRHVDGVSFQAGFINSVLCIISLIFLPKTLKINRHLGDMVLFFLGIAVLAVFFSLSCSHLFWEHIHLLSFVQFPWRFLAVIVFSMSLSGGSVALLIRDTLSKRIALVIIGALIIIVSLATSTRPVFVPSGQEPALDSFLALGEGEYVPQGVSIPPAGPPVRKFEIIRGQGRLGDEEAVNPVNYKVDFHDQEPALNLLCFHTFFFPGWKVFVDGQEAQLQPNVFGLIVFVVPPGDHAIRVVFGSTAVRGLAMIISWVGFALFLIGVIWVKRSRLTS